MGYSHHVKCYLPYSSQADTIRQLLEKQGALKTNLKNDISNSSQTKEKFLSLIEVSL